MNCYNYELAANPSSILLEIANKDGTSHESIPAIIQYVFDDTVILKIKFKPTNWEETKGRSCQLILISEANHEPFKIKGTVRWASFMDDRKRNLYLIGMKLREHNLAACQLLEGLIPPGARDIKEVWRQWDEAQGILGSTRNKIHMLILALILGGIAFLLIGSKIIKF